MERYRASSDTYNLSRLPSLFPLQRTDESDIAATSDAGSQRGPCR